MTSKNGIWENTKGVSVEHHPAILGFKNTRLCQKLGSSNAKSLKASLFKALN